jgi:hypothetical protein
VGTEAILLTKYVLAAIWAFVWTKLVILLCAPAMDGAGFVRASLAAALIAGACALFMAAGLRKFVGTGINPHTYSMDREGVFSLLFSSLVWLVLFGLLLSLVFWKPIGMERPSLSWGSLFWSGRKGIFLDLPLYLVLSIFLVRHRKADLSSRILNDRSCVFESWW